MDTTKMSEGGGSKLPKDGPDPELGGTSSEGKKIVICLGNMYMKDDGIGSKVAEELKKRDLKKVVIYHHQVVDLSSLWHFGGASKVIFVDALKSGAPPGTVSRYTIAPRNGVPTQLPNLHAMQLYDVLDMARQSGQLSCQVTIIGVEPKDCSVGEGLTREVQAALAEVVREVIKELES